MAKFIVKVAIEDCFSVEVTARNAKAAGEKAVKILADLEDPIKSTYFNGSSGFEVYEVEKVK